MLFRSMLCERNADSTWSNRRLRWTIGLIIPSTIRVITTFATSHRIGCRQLWTPPGRISSASSYGICSHEAASMGWIRIAIDQGFDQAHQEQKKGHLTLGVDVTQAQITVMDTQGKCARRSSTKDWSDGSD